MKRYYQRLITTCLLISSFVFLCGIDACEMTPTISGTVSGDIQEGIIIFLTEDGGFFGQTKTDLNGDYNFSV